MPCEEWLSVYQNSATVQLLSGLAVPVVNVIVCFVFEIVAPLEKCLTYTEEDRGIFLRIVIIQFLSVGALFLFSDFTTSFERDDGVPVLMGKWRDYDTGWFYDIGGKVTIAILSNCFTPHIGKSFEPFLHKLVFRWWFDRCCKTHLRKVCNLDESDPNYQHPDEYKMKDNYQKEGGEPEERDP